MRHLLNTLVFLFALVCFAQTGQDFYVVVKENKSIEPTQKIVNPDGSLSLTFNKEELQTLFSSVSVRKYERAFPEAVSKYLQRVYIVNLPDASFLSALSNLNDVEYAESINEGIPLYEPDDPYYTVGGYNYGYTYLILVRANYAWNITNGDPNILIGIADTGFDSTHEDMTGQFAGFVGDVGTTNPHGMYVSGLVSPLTDNNKGVAGIGYNTRMYGIKGLSTQKAYQLAQVPGVKVINASWLDGCAFSPVNQEVYNEIRYVHEVLVIAAAGNGSTCGGPNNYVYPAAYDNVLAVSSVGHTYPIGHDLMYNQTDVHQRFIDPSNPDDNTHQHHDKVDMVAPGFDFWVPGLSNNYERVWHGTSSAAPQVAAAAGLILSVNPNLTPDEVEAILKNTADDIYWIPYNYPYIGLLGTGRLNVFRAVKTTECQDEQNPIVDLIIRDSETDKGDEPNLNTQYMWTSSDIIVRNQNDGRFDPTNQNPLYNGSTPNYIYVRVTNNGCQTSSGTDIVKVNWAKANTSLAYPEYWDGSIVQNSVVFGGEVGTGIIPALEPGQEALVEIPWYVPNPQDYYNINENPWHFCLLAEVISNDDPLTSPYTSNPNVMVRNNNNLAWRNVTVIDVSGKEEIGAAVAVSNPSNSPRAFYLQLVKEDAETGKPIFDTAEVGLKLDNTLYAAWERGGKEATSIEDTKESKRKIIKDNNAIIDNLLLNPNELGTVYLSFNFLTKEMTDKNKFRYHLIQRDAQTNEIMGGETFDIQKKSRPFFVANPGSDKNIQKNEQVTLKAQDIFEAAEYNWYDEDGNLIYSGREFTVVPEISKKYKLEVITEDGFKDYSEVNVNVTPYKLINISPNPANTSISVNYDIENSNSAYLMVTGVTNGTSFNYILEPNSSQKLINLTNYQNGHYIVTLICDGKVVESKNLMKN